MQKITERNSVKKGIDISSHNGIVDMEKVKKNGIDFINSKDFSNSSSVSPGKPTIKSVVMALSGNAFNILSQTAL